MNTPVLIVAYSRYENVLKLINDLKNQGVEKIYLAIDGQKDHNSIIQSQLEIAARDLAVKIDLEIRIWKRDVNLGPAVSVITAIDWFFENVSAGIILEDDLLLSSDAVQYFQALLASFSNVEEVFMVSGSNFFEDETSKLGMHATRYPVIWGWATWANRWRDYRSAMDSLHSVNIPGSMTERWFWQIGTRRCLNGIKDAWDIPLASYQLSAGRVTVLPPVNLISNRGADDFAGNTYIDEWPLNIPVRTLNSSLLHSESLESDDFVNLSSNPVDVLFKRRIYNIRAVTTLPSLISKFLDLFRYPITSRSQSLLKRIGEVKIPI